jgi:predicted transcriptional regulator
MSTAKNSRCEPRDYRAFRFAVGTKNVLPPSCLRLLLAVCEIADTGEPVTMRGLAQRLRLRGPNSIFQTLKHLRDAGLVSWEERRGGTIRPTCNVALWRNPS